MTITPTSTSIFWFRRDFRIDDNTALYHALKNSAKIIPIFIFSPIQLDSKKNKYKSIRSIKFMIDSLKDLDKDIKTGMNYFYGTPIDVFKTLLNKNNVKIEAVYCNKDYTPFSKKRDAEVEQLLSKLGVKFESFHDVCLIPPETIKTKNDSYYQKFTPFYNQYMKNEKLISDLLKVRIGKNIIANAKTNLSISISEMEKKLGFDKDICREMLVKGGRTNALSMMKHIGDYKNYSKERDNLDLPNGTTHLSAYIKFGCISVRELYYKIKSVSGMGKKHDLIKQLVWRDFYIQIMDENPNILEKGDAMKKKYNKLKWSNNQKWFDAWVDGMTGYPIVDAGMRQLKQTGYMHNRARLITASFLVKILKIDWKWGEQYFATQLIDYDPAVNNGNWQWVAGTGADSQPYFRIFNPYLQMEKHDKTGAYVKEWIPELSDANVDVSDLMKWDKQKIRDKYKDIIKDYPLKPIVDYSSQKRKTVKMYKKILE